MNNELVSRMSKDLKIEIFEQERQESFVSRLLYSAFALWLKTITADGITMENQTEYGVSKKYHHMRGTYILENLLEFFPELSEWFSQKDEKHPPVNFLRQRLIRTSDILEINSENKLYLPTWHLSPISGNLSKLFGLPNCELDLSSGLSLFKKADNTDTVEQISLNIAEFYDEYIKNITFQKDEWKILKEYFNPFIKTNSIYKSWVDTPPSTEVYVSRIIDKFGNRIYFVEKNIKNQIYSYKIDDFILKSGLLNKILFYLLLIF